MTRAAKTTNTLAPATPVAGEGASFEPLRVAVARVAFGQNISREAAAMQIAARALSGEIHATGFSQASPPIEESEPPADELEEIDYEQRQPIPAAAWADFLPRDHAVDAIRAPAGSAYGPPRALYDWIGVFVSNAGPIAAPAQSRPAPAKAPALKEATDYLVALRRAGESKPGGNKNALNGHLRERFGLTKHQAEAAIAAARKIEPRPEWDAAGRPAKPSQ